MKNKRYLYKRMIAVALSVTLLGMLSACESKEQETSKEAEPLTIETEDGQAAEETSEDEPFTFVDAHGEMHETTINPDVKMHDYDMDAFVKDGDKMTYSDDSSYTYRLGVDVSEYQGTIDWAQVKAAGYEFAIIRTAYRGYGEEGKLCSDAMYAENIKNALDAGLEVGVYVFSQAINEAEAEEEAQLVMDSLKDFDITGPVVFDPESILDDESRTDDVTGEQFTKNTVAFCEKVKAAGYTPMVYANMMWEAYQLDLTELSDYAIWYADYEAKPQTPYNFEYWQYTEAGTVPGIEGGVDLNIQMVE